MKTFSVNAECRSCAGTGLYVGMAERNGAAVVCYSCKGTGLEKIEVKYTPFEKRKERSKVLRVFKVNPGVCIGDNGGNIHLEDFGGMPFKDWSDGKRWPIKSEDRKHTCPAWWYQSEDYKRKPKWDECLGCGEFSQCQHFPNKQKCWERFDREKL